MELYKELTDILICSDRSIKRVSEISKEVEESLSYHGVTRKKLADYVMELSPDRIVWPDDSCLEGFFTNIKPDLNTFKKESVSLLKDLKSLSELHLNVEINSSTEIKELKDAIKKIDAIVNGTDVWREY